MAGNAIVEVRCTDPLAMMRDGWNRLYISKTRAIVRVVEEED